MEKENHGTVADRCSVVLLLIPDSIMEGEPPARVLPLFSYAENSPTPALFRLRGISPSADGEQGFHPWTLVAFVTLCKFD